MGGAAMAKGTYPELIGDLAEWLASALMGRGLDQEEANDMALDIAERVRHQYGGQLLYIPKGTAFDRNERDAEIFQKFDGKNHGDLAAEYGLTVQHVYRILVKERSAVQGST